MSTDLRFTMEIDGIQKTITSVADANKVIRELTKNFVTLKTAGQDVSKTLNSINEATKVKQNLLMVSKGAVELNHNMQGTQTASANASMALLNLNYVIRDSPYFFQNFALGILAVGNNLNPLIDSFNRLRTEAVGKSISTFALLKQALVGGAGISIAFSVVVTAIQSFVFWQSKADRETKDASDSIQEQIEKVGRLRYEYNQLLKEQSQRLTGSEDTSLERLAMLRSAETGKRGQISATSRELRLTTDPLRRFQLGTNLGVYKDELKNIQKEIDFILFSWNKVYEEENKNNKALKEQKSIVEDLSAQEAKLINIRRGNQNFQGQGIFKRQDVRNFRGDSPEGLSRASSKYSRDSAFGFGGMKDLNLDLEMGKIAARELGNALSSAFEQGNIKLSEFITSLGIAIAKMFLLQGITSLLTGGLFGGASSMLSGASSGGIGIPSGAGFDATRFKKSSNIVQVQGKISTNKNKFIVDIENARDYYNNNEKLITIGRD